MALPPLTSHLGSQGTGGAEKYEYVGPWVAKTDDKKKTGIGL